MNVVLGVGGGIAAYKSAELARALIERGLRVQVVLTDAAQRFITPLTFAALTGRKVITNLFASASSEETLSSAIEHIAVAQENDVMVVAPATADLLARLAYGHADDFLTTTYLAFTGPVVLAPAMNSNMWAHPATQENLKILRKRGHLIVEPEDGLLRILRF
jgi:phosphopantothenoylcysteine decarboxylase/phosphopantothenate--cysteine ligase